MQRWLPIDLRKFYQLWFCLFRAFLCQGDSLCIILCLVMKFRILSILNGLGVLESCLWSWIWVRFMIEWNEAFWRLFFFKLVFLSLGSILLCNVLQQWGILSWWIAVLALWFYHSYVWTSGRRSSFSLSFFFYVLRAFQRYLITRSVWDFSRVFVSVRRLPTFITYYLQMIA